MRRSQWGSAVLAGALVVSASFVAAEEEVASARIAASAATQAEKARQGRLSYQLDQLASAHEQGRALYDRASARPRWVDATTGRVTAIVELKEGARADDLARSVAEAGGSIEGAVLDRVKVVVPAGGLRAIAADPAVRVMRQPYYAEPKVVSQGVKTIKADTFMNRTGDNGTGVTVAIMDGASFAGASGLVGSELPSNTSATDFVLRGGFGDSHGTACAEIVHDVAPGAALVLGGFNGDEVSWAQEIQRLVNTGAKVMSHSLGFDNVAVPNGRHFFAQVADAVNASGVLFVTAAGNEGQKYHQGPWSDKNKNNFLEFKNKTENLPILANAGAFVRVRWDDSFGSSNHDYDLYVVDSGGNLVAKSEGLQRGSQDPIEEVELNRDGRFYVNIRHDPSSPLKSNQKFYVYVGGPSIVDAAYQTKNSTLTLPADARGAVAVAAVAWNTRKLEAYSSQGPTADNRVKPDVAAPDKVATVSYGGSFSGTSAATPHAAGAAALLLSHRTMSTSQLRTALQKATSSGGNSRNNQLGYGILDLSKAN